MSTSQSSDSEQEPFPEEDNQDDEKEIECRKEDQETNLPEQELRKIQKTIENQMEKPAPTSIEVKGNASIHPGPTIIIQNHSSLTDDILEKILNQKPNLLPTKPVHVDEREKGKEKRLEKIVSAIRDYYHTNYVNLNPLPWVPHRSSVDEDFCVELVIKKISDGGHEAR